MKDKENIRTYWLTIRLSKKEQAHLESLYRKSYCRGLSEYARRVILREPVIVKHRSQSADEILTVFLALKNELKALGNNFNQAVKKLHTLDHIAEIRAWAIIHESHYQELLKKAEEIRNKLSLVYDYWSKR